MSAASDLKFLRKIQRLLSEGEFVTTYKFALLQALADLSVEHHALSPGFDEGLKLAIGGTSLDTHHSSDMGVFTLAKN